MTEGYFDRYFVLSLAFMLVMLLLEYWYEIRIGAH